MFTVIGTTTIDLFVSGIDQMPRFDGDEYTRSSLAWCSQPLTLAIGGNGANSAYVLAALGAQAALCSAVGQDQLGGLMVGWLEARGVITAGLLRSAAHGTSTNTTILDERLNRLNFYHPGLLTEMRFEDFPEALWPRTETLLITSYPILRGLRGDGAQGYRAALEAVKAEGGRTAIDIGPAIGAPVTVAELTPLLPLVDDWITNDYELSQATGEGAVDAGAQALLDAGAARVIVKRGKEGAAAYASGAEPVTAAGFPVTATVTVGAGDSFNAGYLLALAEGQPLEAALRFGNATAALVVATGRSVLGAPTREQVETLLAN